MLISQLQNPPAILERTMGMPPGGPKALPIPLAFTALNTTFTLDYTNMQQRNFLDMVQSAWIDNSLSGQPLTITVAASGQVIKFPANKQGYLCLICPNPVKLQFDSTGAVTCSVILLNFPVSNIVI